MTTVPRQSPKKNDTRTYSAWEWAKAYAAWVALLPLYLLFAVCGMIGTMPEWLRMKLLRAHVEYTAGHKMDFRIPPDESIPAYMLRWWRIKRNAFFNIYFHIVLRSDDDRALHDHPWWSFSIVLAGGYYEHTIENGGINKKIWHGPGSMRFRGSGKMAHRLELHRTVVKGDGKGPPMHATTGMLKPGELLIHYPPKEDVVQEMPATTIFITGPVLRRWGFHDKDQWVDAYDWDAYCAAKGINAMRMDGGSDAVQSDRNAHRAN